MILFFKNGTKQSKVKDSVCVFGGSLSRRQKANTEHSAVAHPVFQAGASDIGLLLKNSLHSSTQPHCCAARGVNRFKGQPLLNIPFLSF